MQKWTAVKGNGIKNEAKNASVVSEKRKRKISIIVIVFIVEECSWLSPFHKQTSLFSAPTKVTDRQADIQTDIQTW